MANGYEKYLTMEDRLQRSVITYIKVKYPKATYIHSPNEGKRTTFERYKAKVLGTRSGVPDLQILLNGKTLFLELKTESGKLSPNQKAYLEELKNNGFVAEVGWGFDDAAMKIDNFFKN